MPKIRNNVHQPSDSNGAEDRCDIDENARLCCESHFPWQIGRLASTARAAEGLASRIGNPWTHRDYSGRESDQSVPIREDGSRAVLGADKCILLCVIEECDTTMKWLDVLGVLTDWYHRYVKLQG